MSKNNMEDNLYSKWTNVRMRQTEANHLLWEIDSISRWERQSVSVWVVWVCWCACRKQATAYDSIWFFELVFETAIFNAYACVCNTNCVFSLFHLPFEAFHIAVSLFDTCWTGLIYEHIHRNESLSYLTYEQIENERKKTTTERCWHQFNVERKKILFRREWNEKALLWYAMPSNVRPHNAAEWDETTDI